MHFGDAPSPLERPELWPWSLRVDQGQALDGDEPSDQYVVRMGAATVDELRAGRDHVVLVDEADIQGQANVWATAFAEEFWDGYGMSGASVLYAGWATSEARALTALSFFGIKIVVDDVDALRSAVTVGLPAGDLRLVVDEATVAALSADEQLRTACRGVRLILPGDEALWHAWAQTLSDDHTYGVFFDARTLESPTPARVSAACTAVAEVPGVRLEGLVLEVPRRDDESWVTRYVQILEECVHPGLTLLLAENPGCYAPADSALDRARHLAQTLRAAHAASGGEVPHVEYLPMPSLLAHSCVAIDGDRVVPHVADPAGCPIEWVGA